MTIGINTIASDQEDGAVSEGSNPDSPQEVSPPSEVDSEQGEPGTGQPNMYAFSALDRIRGLPQSEGFSRHPETVSIAAQRLAIKYLSDEDLTRLNAVQENTFLNKEGEIYTRVNALTHEVFSGTDGKILPERRAVAIMTHLRTWNTILDSMKGYEELSAEHYQLLSKVQLGITRAIAQALSEIKPIEAKVLIASLHSEIPQIEDLWGIEVGDAKYEGYRPRRSFKDDPDDYIAKRAIMNAYSSVAQMIKDTYVPESKDDFVVLPERKKLPQYSDIVY